MTMGEHSIPIVFTYMVIDETWTYLEKIWS